MSEVYHLIFTFLLLHEHDMRPYDLHVGLLHIHLIGEMPFVSDIPFWPI